MWRYCVRGGRLDTARSTHNSRYARRIMRYPRSSDFCHQYSWSSDLMKQHCDSGFRIVCINRDKCAARKHDSAIHCACWRSVAYEMVSLPNSMATASGDRPTWFSNTSCVSKHGTENWGKRDSVSLKLWSVCRSMVSISHTDKNRMQYDLP